MRPNKSFLLSLVLLCCSTPSYAQTGSSIRAGASTGRMPAYQAAFRIAPSSAARSIGRDGLADQRCIGACNNGVVFLNAGTFTLSSGIDFAGKSSVTLRGAGPDQTTLVFTGNVNCWGQGASICVRNGT